MSRVSQKLIQFVQRNGWDPEDLKPGQLKQAVRIFRRDGLDSKRKVLETLGEYRASTTKKTEAPTLKRHNAEARTSAQAAFALWTVGPQALGPAERSALSKIAERTIDIDVPFGPPVPGAQQDLAALAMVLSRWANSPDTDASTPAPTVNELLAMARDRGFAPDKLRPGSTSLDPFQLGQLARTRGLFAKGVSGAKLDDLKQMVSSGVAPIVYYGPQRHAAVVTGIHDAPDGNTWVSFRDPEIGADRVLPRGTFEGLWTKAGRQAVQIKPAAIHEVTTPQALKDEKPWSIFSGDREVPSSDDKLAFLNEQPDISGTIAGTGIGDIVDRLHEARGTSNTLVRNIDVGPDALSCVEFGKAKHPLGRVRKMVRSEYKDLEKLADRQVQHNLRGAPTHPLVKDRKKFALATVRSGDGVWLSLKFQRKPGVAPDVVTVRARVRDSDFTQAKEATEELGINLLHGVYSELSKNGPQAFVQSLKDNLHPGAIDIEHIAFEGPGCAEVDCAAINTALEKAALGPSEAPISSHPVIDRMDHRIEVTKAQDLNDDTSTVGTVAEIGAGQLIARSLRNAEGPQDTLWRRVSQYGMEMSNNVYGAQPRAVSRTRLLDMLDGEFAALQDGVKRAKAGAKDKRLFALANTVATNSKRPGAGWMGIDFQTRPGGPVNRVMFHVKMNGTVPEQKEGLRKLGINLIHATRFSSQGDANKLIDALLDGIDDDRVQIDHMETSGKNIPRWETADLNFRLLDRGQAPALIATKGGFESPVSDHFFRRAVYVTPEQNLTHAEHMTISQAGRKAFEADPTTQKVEGEDPSRKNVLIRVGLDGFRTSTGKVHTQKLLKHLRRLRAMGHDVLVTKTGSANDSARALAQTGNLLNAFAVRHDDNIDPELLADDRLRFFVYSDGVATNEHANITHLK